MDSSRHNGAAVLPRHVAAIPYPGRGHINPMTNLCRLLAARDLAVTVVVTEEWLNLLRRDSESPPLPPGVRLLSIPNVLPSERIRGVNYPEFFKAVMNKMGDPVRRLLEELDPPAEVVIADALLPWAVGMCEQLNVPPVSLWTESASVFWALYEFDQLDAAGQLPQDVSVREALNYLPTISPPMVSLVPNATELDILRHFVRKFYLFRTAEILLTTSFYELESSVIDQIRSQFPVPFFPIGPTIPHMLLPSPPHETSHVSWLDSRPERSVLYVSLGSFLSISSSEMEEIAMGLVESEVPFLWVVREGLELSHSCMERVEEGNGLVVPWCDQLRVLCHPSVGGFLTHCGWNSTLEAVYAGVPMLTFPLFWDQEPNSRLVVEGWRIGLRLREGEGVERGEVRREKVGKTVRGFMDLDDEENGGMRGRIADLKERCRDAVRTGGSSAKNLDEFVRRIFSKICY